MSTPRELEAENAKLRELLLQARHCVEECRDFRPEGEHSKAAFLAQIDAVLGSGRRRRKAGVSR